MVKDNTDMKNTIYTGGKQFTPATTAENVLVGNKTLLRAIEEDKYEYKPQLPDFYTEEMANTITTVQSLQSKEMETSAFIVYSDCHYTDKKYEYGRMLDAITYLQASVSVDFVCNLGDTTNDGKDVFFAMPQMGVFRNWVSIMGNHDLYTPAVQRNSLCNIPNAHFSPKSASFYYDDHRHNVRYLFLGLHERGVDLDANVANATTNYAGISYSQLKWLADDALQTRYKVFLLSHATLTREGTGWMPNAYSNYRVIKDLFYAFLAGTKGELSLTLQNDSTDALNVLPYDFSTQGSGKMVASYHGHIHGDADYNNGFWHEIWMDNALCDTTCYAGTENTKEYATANEIAFDVCVINWTTRKINCVRFGAGADRQVDLSYL